MTPQEAINAVSNGGLVSCSKEEYPEIRDNLQYYAGDQIDKNQDIYAMIALNEVKRLDKEFNYAF